MLTPEELRLLHPRKRLAAFIPPTPREVMLAQQQLQVATAASVSEQLADDEEAAMLADLEALNEVGEDEEAKEEDEEEEEEVLQSRRKMRSFRSSSRPSSFRGSSTSIPGFGAPLNLDDFGPMEGVESMEDEESGTTVEVTQQESTPVTEPRKGRGGLTFSTVVDPWAEHEAMTRSGVTTRDSPNAYNTLPIAPAESAPGEGGDAAEVEEPHVGLNRGAGGGGVSSLPVSASYVWSDLVRIDVVSGPPSTSLVFYGPATMRVTSAPFGQVRTGTFSNTALVRLSGLSVVKSLPAQY